MDNDQKPKGSKVAPGVANDQLGENASMEFAQDYDNKSSQKSKKSTQKSSK